MGHRSVPSLVRAEGFGEKNRGYSAFSKQAVDSRPLARAWGSAMHNMLMVPIIALHDHDHIDTGGAVYQADKAQKPSGAFKDNYFWGAEGAHILYTPINDGRRPTESIIPRKGSGSWYEQPIVKNVAPELCRVLRCAANAAAEVEFLGAAYNRAEADIERRFQTRLRPTIQLIPTLIKDNGVATTMQMVYKKSLDIFSFRNFKNTLEECLISVRNRKGQHPNCTYCLFTGSPPEKLFEYYIAGNGSYTDKSLEQSLGWKSAEILSKAKAIEDEIKIVMDLRNNNYSPKNNK